VQVIIAKVIDQDEPNIRRADFPAILAGLLPIAAPTCLTRSLLVKRYAPSCSGTGIPS